MRPVAHKLTIHRSSGAKEPLRLRFLDDVEFDEDDLWDYDHLVTSSGDPRAVVADVDPSGPAFAAGLRPDDAVMAVDGQTDIDRDGVFRMLREACADVVLTVRRQPEDTEAEEEELRNIHQNPAPTQAATLRQRGGETLGPTKPEPKATAPPAPVRAPSPPRPRSTPYSDARSLSPTSLLPSPEGRAPGSMAAPLTPRSAKSSMQLHKELAEVGDTMQKMTRKVGQALAIVKGTRGEVEAIVLSVRKSIQLNPSLSEDILPAAAEEQGGSSDQPLAKSLAKSAVNARRAADRAAAASAAEKRLRVELGRSPERDELEAQIEAELHRQRKERRRREMVNKPVVEALQELEEIAMLGYQNLAGHQQQLEHQQRLLEEVYDALGGHYHARYEVVHATNRTAVTRLKDEPTHEVLRIALEREDTARQNCNWAIKAARGERSAVMMQKAEVQRSARLREKMIAQFRHDDLRGTTFKGWGRQELTRIS